MRLIRRFFVTITAAFIMFSAGHTASNAADRYYTASKPGAANNTCVSEYKYCYEGSYLENGMCIKCPENFGYVESNDSTIKLHTDGITSCKIKLAPGKYYDREEKKIKSCPEGYYCKGGEYSYDKNNNFIGRSECPAGSYCPKESCEPTPCEAGYYCPTDKMSEPTPCDIGYYCPQTGLKSQTICPKGYYCPDVKEDKKKCDAGYYCPYTKQSDKTTAQLDCGTGNYCEAGSAERTQCPDVPLSGSVNTWLPDVITNKQICNTNITQDDITHKKEPEFVSYRKNLKAVTDCQIKLEVNIPCGLVHIYHIKYDSGTGTYSDTEELTSYYISLNKGYYLYERFYEDKSDKCTNTDTSDDALPLYYKKSSPCTDENRDYCYGLAKMPANCQEYNQYPETFGIFTCESGQYKSDTTDPNTIFPKFVDCPIGSYCEKCKINTCPAGYYCPATGLTETTYQNYKCPTGATSKAGSDEITDCFLSKNTTFKDSKGTFSLPMVDINIIATGK